LPRRAISWRRWSRTILTPRKLAKQAKDALDKGQLAEADALLGRAKESEAAAFREARKLKQRAQEAEDKHALNLAKMEASQGNIALTQLRYADAAERFGEAAAKVPQGHDDERWKYLNAEADALYRQGDEFGDNAAAASAIERYRHLAELRPRNAFPSDWARTQNNLGNALERLGERESGTARLEEAVAAYREALKERTRARMPLQWAKSTGNQGVAQMLLAKRRGDAKMAKLAVRQIEAAFTKLRDGGNAPSAAFFEAHLPKVGALAQKLAKR
jgi:tetratricopeptide (TPR) repeat protein